MHNRILGDIERSKFEEIKTLWDLGIKRDILVISSIFCAAGENFENFDDP